MPADTDSEIETPTTPVVEAPVESDSAVETETVAPEPKTYTSWQDALKDADPEELLKHDVIAGRIGQVADKRARELAAAQKRTDDQRAQVEADRAENLRLRNLRTENPIAYANEMDRRDAVSDTMAEEIRRQAAVGADVQLELQKYVTANYPKEVVDSLAGKAYEGTLAQGVAQYYADLDKANHTHQRAEWEKVERPALRKQILAELNGGEPSIDASAGGARAGKDFNSNLEASTALYENRITIQEYTRQAYKNGWR